MAERRHPNFAINQAGCEWRGASWPFATAQTLTALANLLNHYRQDVLGRQQCFDQVAYHGRRVTILFDKTGARYGRGKGLRVLVNGRQIAGRDSLQRVTATLP